MLSEIAAEGDAGAVAALVNAAYRGAGGRRDWTDETGLIAGDRAGAGDVAAMLGDDATTVLVRRGRGPGLLGCVAVEMGGGNRCTISMLVVAPELQAGGIGRVLLADAEGHAADRGARVAKITVVAQREALIAWYERRGYRRTGVLEAFPYGDASVGTPLRDDLRFVVLEKALEGHAFPPASR